MTEQLVLLAVAYCRRSPRKLSISSWVSRVWRMIRAGGMGQGTIAPGGRDSLNACVRRAAALAAAFNCTADRFLVILTGAFGSLGVFLSSGRAGFRRWAVALPLGDRPWPRRRRRAEALICLDPRLERTRLPRCELPGRACRREAMANDSAAVLSDPWFAGSSRVASPNSCAGLC